MQCPKCSIHFFETQDLALPVYRSSDGRGYLITANMCPNCNQLVVKLHEGQVIQDENGMTLSPDSVSRILFPLEIKKEFPVEVPQDFAQDYNEALVVLRYSPKASAALSRRLLQKFLRTVLKISKESTLSEEISRFLEDPSLPEHLRKSIDAIRNVGNYAAHPLRDKESGLIVDVEPDEAAWLLEILEELFDLYFVRPKVDQQRRDRLNAKLSRLGKGPLKEGV